MKKLPIEIIYIIQSYSYSQQNAEHLEDIRHFYKSKRLLLSLYNKKIVLDLIDMHFFSTNNEDKIWLINDIFAWSNNNYPTNICYINKFYNIFFRNFMLNSMAKIDKYIENMEKKFIDTQINIFWGLITVNERKQIINFYFSENEIFIFLQ